MHNIFWNTLFLPVQNLFYPIVPRNYIGDDKVIDITVEDPSDNFVRLRDFVDTRNCLKLAEFGKSEVLKGFSDNITVAAAKHLKICKKQARCA